ncbi:hypothetical protein BGZ58_000665 [Dissophora ornata]|nr:hypothetical protein BGZ58_000665 [Dissophora ornata]
MGESSAPSSNSTQQGSSSASSAAKSSSGQGSGSKKTAAKLNPDAVDYVPRAPAAEGASVSTSSTPAGGSNSNSRNRRRRNPDPNKSGPNGESSKPPENKRDGNSNNNSSNNNSGNSRNRRNRGRAPKQPADGGARIDDDDDDDIEINMDRPVEPSEAQIVGSESAPGSGSGPTVAANDRRRDGRRKGKEVADASSSRPQQSKGDKGRSRAPGADRKQESSSSSARASGTGGNNTNGGSSSNNNNSRRQRNRKTGDLGGRTFPVAPNPPDQGRESSGTQRAAQRNSSRVQPKKFVHTVEEDRDLMAALTSGLTNSTYDCMVCWDVIRPAHKVWNCQVCWAAFHLDCLSTWAKKSSEVRAILALARPVVAKVRSSPATAVTKASKCAVSKPTSHSRLESRVTRSAENCWDVANTLAPRYVTQDCAHLARKLMNKSVTAESMNVKRAVVMESKGRL